METALEKEKKDNTFYTIRVQMAVKNGRFIYGIKELVYLGMEKGDFTKDETNTRVSHSISPTIHVNFSKNSWGTPLRIRGIRELQEHLDVILEGCYNGAYVITSLSVDATNDDWKSA